MRRRPAIVFATAIALLLAITAVGCLQQQAPQAQASPTATASAPAFQPSGSATPLATQPAPGQGDDAPPLPPA
ncbi:MAG: hypothetical protein V1817_01755 [Candidatus Micrarchaeota archaeon]